MGCPVKNQQYKELEDIYGVGKTLALWHKNGEKTPTPLEAIKSLYGDRVQPNDQLRPWDLGTYEGKLQNTYEPQIDALIKENPDAPVGGGESFNQVKNRAIEAAKQVLSSAPENAVVVTHSSLLKFIMLWDKMGRPDDLSNITPEKYLAVNTVPGQTFTIAGDNGDILLVRHGESTDNAAGKLRSDDAKLTDEGEQEAETLGNKLSRTVIPVVYTSPLNRTLHTTDLIMSEQKVPQQPAVYYQLDTTEVLNRIYKGFQNVVHPIYQGNMFIGLRANKGVSANKTVATAIQKWIDKIPEFSNVRVTISPTYGTINFQDKTTGIMYQLEDININNIKQVKHELQSIVLKGFGNEAERDTIQKALSIARTGKRANKKSNGKKRAIHEKVGEYWNRIKEAGLEYTEGRKGTYLFAGAEHSVYLDEGGDTVTKFNETIALEPDWIDEYLERLLVYNWLFPGTAYELLGFVKEQGDIKPVVRQSYIPETKDADYNFDVIKSKLEESGFKRVSNDEFINKDLGIGIKDLYPKNVLFREGLPFFIDPMIYLLSEFYKQEDISHQLPSESQESVDTDISKKLEGFIKSTGGNIKYVDNIVHNGQVIPANAMVDVVKRTIEVVSGREKIDTLPEEAAHIYVHWLPSNSVLLRDMLKDIKNRPEYDKVMAQYSTNPLYQNSDGTVDENKIAIEAIGKVIAGVIVGKVKDKKAMSWWQKILSWLTGIFKGKDYDAYQVAASDILAGRVKNLDMKAMKEANQKGEIYFSLSDEDQKLVDKQLKNATKEQKEAVDKLIVNPENRVLPEGTIYTDDKGNEYQSIDSKVGDIFNAQQGSLVGDSYIDQYSVDGNIAFPQVSVATPYDPDSSKRVAGTVPVLVIHPNGEVSVIDVTDSTNKIANSVKVGSYAKMLSLMGFNVRTSITRDSSNSHIVQHEDSANRDIIDSIVPGEWQGKQAIESDNPFRKEEAPTDEQLENRVHEVQQELVERVLDLYNATTDWKKVLQDMRTNTSFQPKQEAIQAVDQLLSAVQVEFQKGADYSSAYTVFLDNAISQLNILLPYLSERSEQGELVHTNNRDMFRYKVAMTAAYINTYKGLYHTEEFTTPAQEKKYRKLDRLLRETAIAIESAQQYMADKDIDSLSVNQAVKNQMEDAEWQGLQYRSGYNIAPDIGAAQAMMGSLGGNTVTDVTLKRLSDIKEGAREKTKITKEHIHEVANRLKAAGVEDYSFMMETDKDGNWTGHIVTNIGDTYKNLRAKVEEPLQDYVTGEGYQYRSVKSTDDKKEDIDYNNDLWAKKQAYGKFMSAETIDIDPETGEVDVQDGKYHEYIPGFKQERDDYMYVDVDPYGNARWKFKSTRGMSKEFEEKLKEKYPGKSKEEAWKLECHAWREKNYNYSPYDTIVKDKQGKPTGVVKRVEGDSAWFPKQELVQPRLIAADKTKLAPEKYYRLMNPQTIQEEAMSEFYNMYIKIMQDKVAQLPVYATYWFQKGNVPSILANTLDMLADKGADTMTVLMSQMKEMLPKGHISGSGEMIAKKSIPVAFISNLQDANRLRGLEDELGKLVSKKDSMSSTAYDKRYKEITDAINTEKKKLSASKLHKDLTLGLTAFVEMADTHEALANAEQELLNMKHKILNMQFEQEGGLVGQKRIVSGAESRTYQRFQWFLDNEFYNDDAFNKTMLDAVVNKLMNATSAAAIGFNLTGMINNAFVASLNNSIESWGGDFFNRKSYQKMQKLFTTEFMPGYVKTLGQHKSRNKNKEYYGEKKAGSKYEALVRHFNMVSHQHDIHNGKVSWLGKLWGYMGYEAGEYMVQSQIGNAILDTVMLKKGNEELSVYDAFDWDANTDTLTLKDGYDLDNTQKHDITHRIWKTNERIHGNYRWKIMLQKYTVGRLALQFHKWVYPNYRQRFQKMQFDEALGGGMDIEGRYTTLWNFSKSIVELKSRAAAWDKLNPLQRNNLKKDLADALYVSVLIGAYYIIKKLADGIPDDDPYLKKMANWMSKEADRGSQELSIFMPGWGLLESYRLIKNPFAVTNSLMKFTTLLTDISHMPFQEHEDWYYQKGVFTGQLKVSKDAKDLVPLLREINEWYRLDQQSNFFIR